MPRSASRTQGLGQIVEPFVLEEGADIADHEGFRRDTEA